MCVCPQFWLALTPPRVFDSEENKKNEHYLNNHIDGIRDLIFIKWRYNLQIQESLRSSPTVSPGFNLIRHRSLSFGPKVWALCLSSVRKKPMDKLKMPGLLRQVNLRFASLKIIAAIVLSSNFCLNFRSSLKQIPRKYWECHEGVYPIGPRATNFRLRISMNRKITKSKYGI